MFQTNEWLQIWLNWSAYSWPKEPVSIFLSCAKRDLYTWQSYTSHTALDQYLDTIHKQDKLQL